MASVRVSRRQSLLDVAIQKSGSVLAAIDLAVKNGLSITDDLMPGESVNLVDVKNSDIKAYYEAKNIVPATAFTADDQLVAAELEGISYWVINVDFVIQ
ncbi:hypothetical protein [Labilibaculum euxinus]